MSVQKEMQLGKNKKPRVFLELEGQRAKIIDPLNMEMSDLQWHLHQHLKYRVSA